MARVIFDEGAKVLADTGWPTSVAVCLSTKPCSGAGAHVVGDTLVAAAFGEATWTGSARQTVTEPAAAATGGTKVWTAATFTTGSSTNGPAACRSVVYIDTVASKLLAAVDLPATRDMSLANVTEIVTLTSSVA